MTIIVNGKPINFRLKIFDIGIYGKVRAEVKFLVNNKTLNYYEAEKVGDRLQYCLDNFEKIEAENNELKEQIEKLKNCSNCNNQECLRIILMAPNKDKFKIVNTEECTKENHKYWRL